MKRICRYCGETKPIESFYKNRDGFLWRCKVCCAEFQKEYFKTHKRKSYYKSQYDPSKHHGRPLGSHTTNRVKSLGRIPIKPKVGIYKIQSKLFPDRIYIGSSKDIIKRWYSHGSLKHQLYRNYILEYHVKKYGYKDLIFSILKICKSEHLVYWEQFYISELNPYFNLWRFASEPNSKSNEAKECAMKDNSGAAECFAKELQLLILNNDYKEEIIPLNII